MDLIIKNGTIVSPTATFKADVCVDKGKIVAITSDAGIDADKVVDASGKMHSDCDHTIWEGVKVKGYPEATYSRGKLVFKDGEFLGERGWGKFIKRSSSGNL